MADVGEKPTAEELAEIATEGDSPEKESDVVSTATVAIISQEEKDALMSVLSEPIPHHPDTHPYLNKGFKYPEGWKFEPMVYRPEKSAEGDSPEGPKSDVVTSTATVTETPLFVQNEEQQESNLWSSTAKVISEEDYMNVSQEKIDEKVNLYIGMLKNKQIDPKDIPPALLSVIKSRM